MTHALLRLQESRVKQEQQQLSACDTATAEAEAQMHRNTSGGDVGDWIGMDTGLSMRQSVKLVRQGGGAGSHVMHSTVLLPRHKACSCTYRHASTELVHAYTSTEHAHAYTRMEHAHTYTSTEWCTHTQAQNGACIHKHDTRTGQGGRQGAQCVNEF